MVVCALSNHWACGKFFINMTQCRVQLSTVPWTNEHLQFLRLQIIFWFIPGRSPWEIKKFVLPFISKVLILITSTEVTVFLHMNLSYIYFYQPLLVLIAWQLFFLFWKRAKVIIKFKVLGVRRAKPSSCYSCSSLSFTKVKIFSRSLLVSIPESTLLPYAERKTSAGKLGADEGAHVCTHKHAHTWTQASCILIFRYSFGKWPM